MYEVILHYKAKKEKKNEIRAQTGIDPGPLVPKSDTLTTRPRCQDLLEITAHPIIGQTG